MWFIVSLFWTVKSLIIFMSSHAQESTCTVPSGTYAPTVTLRFGPLAEHECLIKI